MNRVSFIGITHFDRSCIILRWFSAPLDNAVVGINLLSFIDPDPNIFEVMHIPTCTFEEFRYSQVEFNGEHLLKIMKSSIRSFHKNLE